MSQRSPSFNRSGFHPLGHPDMQEHDIPLTPVRTAGSTGARRPSDNLNQYPTHQTFKENEKNGRFSGGKRKIRKITSKKRSPDEDVSVNGLGRFYNKVVQSSVVTRYLVYILPVGALIAIPIIIYGGWHHEDLFAGTGVKVYLFWAWIEIVWVSLWLSKLVAKLLPGIFMFLCGVVSSGTRKYATIIKELEIPLSLVGWAVTALVTFRALTSAGLNEGNQKHWLTVMLNVLAPALIASLIYLGEKTIIQLISVNYHRRSFEGRIRDSKHNVHLLGLLFEASRTLFPMYCPEFAEEDYVINDSIEMMLAKNVGHKRSGSATPLRLIGDVGRFGDKVTSAFGNIASEITGKQVFNPNSAHSIVIEALEKTKSSEALAKRLWMSFVVEGEEALSLDDLREVLGPAGREEADEAFAALDNDLNGDISLDEMIMKVVEIGRDRKSIASSMRDVGQAIGVLDQVAITVLFVIIIFVFVAFQDTNFVTTLATAGTTLLSLSFVFATSVQEFLGSCIFLFVKHPYDVGDRVDIVGPEKEFLVVEQISLLFTIFKRIDTMKMVQVPNIVLNNLWVENITRSQAMKEQLDMFISFDTSLEDIELLRTEMEIFVRHPDNARDFQPDIILEATGIGNMDKLQLKVEIRHKSNWHNETVRAARRSKFMCALVLALRKVPIYAPGGGGEPLGGPTNPGYSVAVSDTWATEARGDAAKTKEGKRLVPTRTADSDNEKGTTAELGSEGEQQAAEALNARHPTADAAHRDDDREAWNSRDDVQTLHSVDDMTAEERRSMDIDNLRTGLLKRESTRGRRKKGESAPTIPSAAGPGLSVTAPLTNVVDEESELDTPYGSGIYSMFPAPSQGSRGAQLQQQQMQEQQQQHHQQQQQQQMYTPYGGASAAAAAPGQTTQTAQVARAASGRLRRLSLGFRPNGSGSGNGAGAAGSPA